MEKGDCLITGVLESYVSTRDYFGNDKVIPIYVEVEDGERLTRALNREKKPGNHKYAEMCRRFLSDNEDFSEREFRHLISKLGTNPVTERPSGLYICSAPP